MNSEPAKSEAEYPVPAVRVIVRDERGRVLLLKRKMATRYPGKWCLPGGKVEYGETIEQAASRELYEETSLVCTSMLFLFYQDSLPLEPGGMHCVNLYLECHVKGAPVLGEESSRIAWIRPDELPQYQITFRNDEGLARYWKERGLGKKAGMARPEKRAHPKGRDS